MVFFVAKVISFILAIVAISFILPIIAISKKTLFYLSVLMFFLLLQTIKAMIIFTKYFYFWSI